MWVYLKEGFYSIVHKPPCREDELMVRVRCRHDLDKLKKMLKAEYAFNGVITDLPHADYAYRMIVPRKTLSSFLANVAMVRDYDNFKNTIGRNDYRRSDASCGVMMQCMSGSEI
jgi:hypothetical protein